MILRFLEDSTNNYKPHLKFIAVISCHDLLHQVSLWAAQQCALGKIGPDGYSKCLKVVQRGTRKEPLNTSISGRKIPKTRGIFKKDCLHTMVVEVFSQFFLFDP